MRKNLFTSTIALLFAAQVLFSQSLSTFINEVNYLASNPTERGVEIAGEAGQDLTGWSIVMYALDGTVAYVRYISSGVIPDQQNGYGTIWYDVEQSGNEGGLALVNAGGNVVQFISYGTINYANVIITAVAGPANGLTSEYIGTQLLPENGLQLTGSGILYDQFLWSLPGTGTPGAINLNQLFGLVPLFPQRPAQSNPISLATTDATDDTIELHIYPNPTINHVFLQNTSDQKTWVQILGENGKVLKSFYVGAAETQELDLSDLGKGIFIFYWRSGSAKNFHRVLKL